MKYAGFYKGFVQWYNSVIDFYGLDSKLASKGLDIMNIYPVGWFYIKDAKKRYTYVLVQWAEFYNTKIVYASYTELIYASNIPMKYGMGDDNFELEVFRKVFGGEWHKYYLDLLRIKYGISIPNSATNIVHCLKKQRLALVSDNDKKYLCTPIGWFSVEYGSTVIQALRNLKVNIKNLHEMDWDQLEDVFLKLIIDKTYE